MMIHDHVFVFTLSMCIILLVPLIFERFRIQGIIGLIIAGTIVGPNTLGLLSRDGIFEMLGTVGLLLIMFLAGLEVNLNEFSRHRRPSMVFGAATFIIPLTIGSLTARFGWHFSWPASILLAAMFSSHTLVSYPILNRLGLAKNRAVTAVIGGTIITDTAAMLVLAIIAESTSSSLSALFWIRLGASLGFLMFVSLVVLPRLGYWFFRSISADGVVEFVFVMTMVFLMCSLSKLLGIEPILGSFFAGLALSNLIPEQSALMNRLKFVPNSLFIPFFLISTGMLVDFRVLGNSPYQWGFASYLIVAVIAAKWLGAAVSGRLLGFTRDERQLMFGLSVNHAAATLATVMVGYRIGLFNDTVLNGTIIIILVSCTIGAWMTDKYCRRLLITASMDSPEKPMTAAQRIMIPVSNPATAISLIDLAVMLRKPRSSEPVFPLHVVQEGSDVDSRVAAGEVLLGKIVAQAAACDVPMLPVIRIDLNSTSGIMHALKEQRISTLVIGWYGQQSAKNLLIHSVMEQIIEQSSLMIVVAKLVRPLNTTERILLVIPPLFDKQPGNLETVTVVKNLAVQVGAGIHCIGDERTIDAVRPLMERTPPKCAIFFRTVVTWRDIPGVLESEMDMGDMVVLLSSRREQLGWQPSLDRLPGKMHDASKDTNFLIIYSPFQELESLHKITPDYQLTTLPGYAPHRVLQDTDETTFEGFLDALLKTETSWSGEDRKKASALLRSVAPVELSKGMVLLHMHDSTVVETMFFYGASEAGVSIPGTGEPVHTLLILASPLDQTPETHLRILASIVRAVRAIQENCRQPE